jgi:hypothetical protein
VEGNVEKCLLVAAWGCLPAPLGGTMFGRLIAGGIRGGDAVHLLGGVPENVVVLALVRVLHAAFGSRECPP